MSTCVVGAHGFSKLFSTAGTLMHYFKLLSHTLFHPPPKRQKIRYSPIRSSQTGRSAVQGGIRLTRSLRLLVGLMGSSGNWCSITAIILFRILKMTLRRSGPLSESTQEETKRIPSKVFLLRAHHRVQI